MATVSFFFDERFQIVSMHFPTHFILVLHTSGGLSYVPIFSILMRADKGSSKGGNASTD